jgi:hypothetical protein
MRVIWAGTDGPTFVANLGSGLSVEPPRGTLSTSIGFNVLAAVTLWQLFVHLREGQPATPHSES